MKTRTILISILISIFSLSVFAGGGWPKKKGKYYVKVAGWYVESNTHFSGEGDKAENPTASLFNLNVFAEYGITDKLTAIGYIPFFSRSVNNRIIDNRGRVVNNFPGEAINSIGDSQLGLKYGVYQNNKISLAISYTIDLPIGQTAKGELGTLATGDGELNHIFRTDLGISIFNSDQVSLYGNVYGGINVRSKDFSEELRLGAEFGAGFLDKKLWVVGKFDTIQSLNNGDRNFDNGNSFGLFVNNVEVTSLTPEVSYLITKKIGISAAVSIPLAGQFVYDSPSYTGGVFIDVN